MKAFYVYLILLITFFSCKKDENKCNCPTATVSQDYSISILDSIYYGKNILYFADSTLLTDSKTYGLGAVLGKDATFSIIITNLSSIDSITGHIPDWGRSDNTGWLVHNYNTYTNTQKFTAIQTGKIDLGIAFFNYATHGKCRIDFYENSTSVTKTKYLKW